MITRGALVRLEQALGVAIAALDENDFEFLVGLISHSLGWRRVNPLGGVQKHTDLVVQQPLTGETAAVQVESSADRKTIVACFENLRAYGLQRSIVACHSPAKGVKIPPACGLWDRGKLASMVVRSGLGEWVLARAL